MPVLFSVQMFTVKTLLICMQRCLPSRHPFLSRQMCFMLEYRLCTDALFFQQLRCLYVLGNTVFLQQSVVLWQICQMSLQGIGSEIGSRLRDGTFKNCVAKCPGGASRRRWGYAVRNGPSEESREGSGAEEVVALLQRKEISPHSLPRLSPQLVAPFSSTVTRDNLPLRVYVRVFAGIAENTFSDCLPGVFLCPVITASPVTGCNQVVLFASSLLVEENGGKGKT